MQNQISKLKQKVFSGDGGGFEDEIEHSESGAEDMDVGEDVNYEVKPVEYISKDNFDTMYTTPYIDEFSFRPSISKLDQTSDQETSTQQP